MFDWQGLNLADLFDVDLGFLMISRRCSVYGTGLGGLEHDFYDFPYIGINGL